MRISIITPTFNSELFLECCVKSVASQTYNNIEHIVIDGASVDKTIQIVNKCLDKISVFKSEPDTGIYNALNKGLKNSTGDIVGFLHSDDFYASNDSLESIANSFIVKNVDAVYGDLEYVDRLDSSKVLRRWRSCEYKDGDLGWGWMPPHPTFYVRREWYERINGFEEKYKISADYLSVLKMFSNPIFKATYIPKVITRMRIGGVSNQNVRSIIKKTCEDWQVLRSQEASCLKSIRCLAWKNISKVKQFQVF